MITFCYFLYLASFTPPSTVELGHWSFLVVESFWSPSVPIHPGWIGTLVFPGCRIIVPIHPGCPYPLLLTVSSAFVFQFRKVFAERKKREIIAKDEREKKTKTMTMTMTTKTMTNTNDARAKFNFPTSNFSGFSYFESDDSDDSDDMRDYIITVSPDYDVNQMTSSWRHYDVVNQS